MLQVLVFVRELLQKLLASARVRRRLDVHKQQRKHRLVIRPAHVHARCVGLAGHVTAEEYPVSPGRHAALAASRVLAGIWRELVRGPKRQRRLAEPPTHTPGAAVAMQLIMELECL